MKLPTCFFFIFCSLFSLQIYSSDTPYHISFFTGQDQKAFISFIANLRISEYRQYPYLYEGNIDEEAVYLNWLFDQPSSLLAIAYYNDEPIGFTSGVNIPAWEEHFPGSVAAFHNAGLFPEKYYYITDIIVLPQYRGSTIASQLSSLLEEYAQQQGYTGICCVIEDHDAHPLKPTHYISIGATLLRHGYTPSSIMLNFPWLTLNSDGSSTLENHALHYWIKNLSPKE